MVLFLIGSCVLSTWNATLATRVFYVRGRPCDDGASFVAAVVYCTSRYCFMNTWKMQRKRRYPSLSRSVRDENKIPYIHFCGPHQRLQFGYLVANTDGMTDMFSQQSSAKR